MTRTKLVERLLRLLVTLLGAAVGAGAAALLLPLICAWAYPSAQPPIWLAPSLYAGLGLLGALILFIFSRAITAMLLKQSAALMRRWDEVPMQQTLLATVGMVLGLAVAALLTQLILSAGSSLLTVTVSAILYVLLGYIGLQTGYRKYQAFGRMEKRFMRRFRHRGETLDELDDLIEEPLMDEDAPTDGAAPVKLLDTSALIDGRVTDVYKTGFLEGALLVPGFVIAELQRIADSADDLKRARGRRGLDVLNQLKGLAGDGLLIESADSAPQDDVDVRLLKLAKARGGAVVTNDYNLGKVALVSGIRVLNINELANAVKPMLMAGEELMVQIVKEGKEIGQGVGYLSDGTMIVVEGGRAYLGQRRSTVVSTVLQTNAGRMIFVKLKDTDTGASQQA